MGVFSGNPSSLRVTAGSEAIQPLYWIASSASPPRNDGAGRLLKTRFFRGDVWYLTVITRLVRVIHIGSGSHAYSV